jgi:uncharacterized Rmd1/YagE family protein
MNDSLFEGRTEIEAVAMYVGQRLDLRAFEHFEQLASGPLAVRAGASGAAVLFRYGVVVFFGLTAAEAVGFLQDIGRLIIDAIEEPQTEEVVLVIQEGASEGVEQSHIRLQSSDIERLQLVADVLAKSVVLAHYEITIAAQFDRIEPLATNLKQAGRTGHKGRELLKYIGDMLTIESKMVGRVGVSEKPELLWEHPGLERLYARLEDEYELEERHIALDRKLMLISRTAETLSGILQNQRSLRVEWYIVILIVLEIVITLADKFVG